MDLEHRIRQLEIQVTALTGEHKGHVVLCDGRWRVIWKLSGGLAAFVAAIVSVTITMLRP